MMPKHLANKTPKQIMTMARHRWFTNQDATSDLYILWLEQRLESAISMAKDHAAGRFNTGSVMGRAEDFLNEVYPNDPTQSSH